MEAPDRIFVGPEAMAYTKRISDGDEEYVRAALVTIDNGDERAELELRREEGKTVSDMLGLPETTTIDAIVAAIGALKQRFPRWDWKLNEPQRATVEELRRILPGAHMVNVKVRIDGEWREFQADWLRDAIALPSFPEKG